jgi:ubiquinone/menaquinone biosynthesis C-methylase UbiE
MKIRNAFSSRKRIVEDIGIKQGDSVLDYGCGPGGYIPALSELVGESGKVYALDIHPLAVKKIQGIASKKNLSNVETILTDYDTGLPDKSIDVVVLYDTLRHHRSPDKTLREIHRVLKMHGILSYREEFLDEKDIPRVADSGLLVLERKSKNTFIFTKKV